LKTLPVIASSLELAQQGAKRLPLVTRDEARLAEVATEIEALGVEVVTLALDLTQAVEVNIAIAQAWRDCGPIHLQPPSLRFWVSPKPGAAN